MIKKIEVVKKFGFEELEERLRRVSLRGFPDTKIYENSNIHISTVSPEQVRRGIFTPQPSVYATELKKVLEINELFLRFGIDIFDLKGGVDYVAHDEAGEVTEWTMIPPVAEVLPIRFGLRKGLDYSEAVGTELLRVMKEKGYVLNPEVQDLDYPEYKRFRGQTKSISEICDGSHRIELGVRRGLPQNILLIENVRPGFPYYAAPKPYSSIHEEPERVEEKIDKTHVLTSPAHKLLYRLFPSGGINSGNVRPLKQKFD
jgi:hypothetical protein